MEQGLFPGRCVERQFPTRLRDEGGVGLRRETRTGVVPGRRGLFVIRRDDSVAVVGFPAGDAYVVTGFCDHNAALIRIDGREQDFDEMQGPSVPVDWFAAAAQSVYAIRATLEFKTTWHPIGA